MAEVQKVIVFEVTKHRATFAVNEIVTEPGTVVIELTGHHEWLVMTLGLAEVGKLYAALGEVITKAVNV